MKVTCILTLAAATLASATAIDKEANNAPAAPQKWENLRMQFSPDYDCKWRKDGKGPLIHDRLPRCNTDGYKRTSFMFDKLDEPGNKKTKCFSAKDLNLYPGQENWHSFSFCMPPRLRKNGCSFKMYGNIHCEDRPVYSVNTTDTGAEGNGDCINMDADRRVKHLTDGGARSVKIECPAKQESPCPDDDQEEDPDNWWGEPL